MRNREVGTKHVFAGGTRLVSKLVVQPKDVDGYGEPDPLPGCDREPWGWTQGNGGQGQGQGVCSNNGNGPGAGPEVFEKDQYYFHPDHLGSSSYVTDLDGEIFQHLEYFPFGETWVEEHSNTQRTPYLFTAKELDEETGLYYFGARYYDPRTSVWQSPDPILAEYLSSKSEELTLMLPDNENGYSAPFFDLPGYGGFLEPKNFAAYSYAHLNGPNVVDPDGEQAKKTVGWAVERVAGGLRQLGRVTREQAIQLRRQGQDFLADRRQIAQSVEDAAAGGKPIVRHEGHQLRDGSGATGRPHFQDPNKGKTGGRDGHAFWSWSGGAGSIAEAVGSGAMDALEGLGSGLEGIGEVFDDLETNFPRTMNLLCAFDPVCLTEQMMRPGPDYIQMETKDGMIWVHQDDVI